MGVLSGVLGGITGGVTDAGGFAVDTVMKVANFVGLKNVVGLGAAGLGLIGDNHALAFAGGCSLLGGKSTLATLALTGAGFAIGSMLDAEEAANDIAKASAELPETSGLDSDAPESTNRYLDTDAGGAAPAEADFSADSFEYQ